MRAYILPGNYHISHCATKPDGGEGKRRIWGFAGAKVNSVRVIADPSQSFLRLRHNSPPPMILIRIENDYSA